jgi:hypothetical protein
VDDHHIHDGCPHHFWRMDYERDLQCQGLMPIIGAVLTSVMLFGLRTSLRSTNGTRNDTMDEQAPPIRLHL